MRFLADENIHSSVVEFLRSKGLDVVTVVELDKARIKDTEVADLAQKEKRIILTLDLDFGYIYYFEKRGLINVVVVRAKPAAPEKIIILLEKFLKSKIEPKGLVVVSEKRIRILQ